MSKFLVATEMMSILISFLCLVYTIIEKILYRNNNRNKNFYYSYIKLYPYEYDK